MKTGIIIPCYNEETRLNPEAFLSFVASETNYHLCFVNDGSKDQTLRVLQEMQLRCPESISIVDIKRNVGKAAAVRAGARYLYNCGDYSEIGFMDADLSTDFRDFKELVKTLKEEKQLVLVFGSRNSGGNGIERDGFRKLMSNMVKFCIKFILGLPIRDTQCGAKVFHRDVIPVAYSNPFVTRWLFDVEIFLRLKRYYGKQDCIDRIFEQPLMRWVHVDDSKLDITDSLKIPYKLLHIWFDYNFQRRFAFLKPENDLQPQFDTYDVAPSVRAA